MNADEIMALYRATDTPNVLEKRLAEAALRAAVEQIVRERDKADAKVVELSIYYARRLQEEHDRAERAEERGDAAMLMFRAAEQEAAELKLLWFADADPKETKYSAEYEAAIAKAARSGPLLGEKNG